MTQIDVAGQLYEFEPEDTVLTVLRRHELPVTSACGGKGTCHLCRVKVLSPRELLPSATPAEHKGLGNMRLAQGYRLACQIHPCADLKLEASEYRHRPKRLTKKKSLKKGIT